MEPMTDYTDPVAEFMWPLSDFAEPNGDPTFSGLPMETTTEAVDGFASDVQALQADSGLQTSGEANLDQEDAIISTQTPIHIPSDAQPGLRSSGNDSGSLRTLDLSNYSSVSGSCSSSWNGEGASSGDEDPIAYARYHGLCRDYESEYVLDTDVIPLPSDDEFGDVHDFSSLGYNITSLQQSLDERLDVGKDTAAYLSTVLSMGKDIQEGESYDEDIRLRQLKLEVPLLQTDHDAEILRLRRKCCVKISSKGMAPFKLDNKKDEGPDFPPRYTAAKSVIDHEIKDAKLDLPRETVESLKDIHGLLTQEGPDLADEAWEEQKENRNKSGYLTPPLVPPSPLRSLGQPASEAMMIDATSTPEDLLAQENEFMQRALQAADDASPAQAVTEDPARSLSLRRSQELIESFVAASSSSSPLERKRLRNLRLESPLTPQGQDELPAVKQKKVKLSPGLASLLPQPGTDSSTESNVGTSDEINAFVQDVVTPFAEAVNKQVQREELSEADATIRVKTPFVVEIKPTAPWEQYADAASGRLLAQRVMLRQLKEKLLAKQEWSGVRKQERGMSWTPFSPGYGRVDLNEVFDDGSCGRYLAELDLEGEIDVDVLIARTSHLQILEDHDTDVEYIEPLLPALEVEDTADKQLVCEMQAATEAAKKSVPDRAMSQTMQPRVSTTGASIRKGDLLALLRRKQKALANRSLSTSKAQNGDDSCAPRKDMLPSNPTKAGPFAEILQNDGLAHFMQLHGKNTVPRKLEDVPSRMVVHNVAPAAVMVAQPTVPAPPRPVLQLPVPELSGAKSAPFQVVLSTNFMANCHMARQLQALLPDADMVELDTSGVLGEADLTLSPSTGLMMTTLQKLKQRPLPRQTGFLGVRERIAAVARRYEHLIVLVSEGNAALPEEPTAFKALDERDCSEMTGLTNSSVSMDTTVEVIYVAGGDAELVKWIASAVCRHGIADGHTRLLQDETKWERFLRRAGMNAYAAQAVMADLKIPETGAQPQSSSYANGYQEPMAYGLAAFVAMPAAERAQRFESLLGGSTVMRKVNEVLDSAWSAGNVRVKP